MDTAVVKQTTLKVGNNTNHLFEYFKFNSAPCNFGRDYYYFRVSNITDHDFADSDNSRGSSPRYKLDIFKISFEKNRRGKTLKSSICANGMFWSRVNNIGMHTRSTRRGSRTFDRGRNLNLDHGLLSQSPNERFKHKKPANLQTMTKKVIVVSKAVIIMM